MKSYFIKEVGEPLAWGKAVPAHYSFIIVDENGLQIKYFEKGRGKLFYLVVIRKDLNYFQHLHPALDQKTGIFTLPNLKFPEDGEYRMLADFIPLETSLQGLPHATAFTDFSIGSKWTPKPLGSAERIQTFGIYNVALQTEPEVLQVGPAVFSFSASIDQKPITDLEDHLGAGGHLMIFRRDTLKYEHAVAKEIPQRDAIRSIQFETSFRKPGTYKIFMEFKHKEKTTACDFVISVKR